ncbi:hypothetical protein A2954_00100 [Candidatus Roizmanbacteria bacterium RIFCSPLOWO2_01_FULL_37_12]|uniref:Glycosyltransferase RgtA/B/C/D-like domain-containing protein n=1 Tax=Candidatus Roizmanbacteria bacterium RIFCSPLOWO2_01_FULL_37_12 TaxID=1802056 RepID=A0A1F7IBE1_9BACT|nr:MAG: hypothetical protein A3D76_00425 [Candidatus Roizmanbacteria bacterium RIFCSPHIGHO2_02_FULL_37_9b]OGK40685.1 MAG: hypothetical protein A2954_00100 [Candidatus Roizmanbacteria bacterium RIFCSPLOWO2_01_FULL_37_12]
MKNKLNKYTLLLVTALITTILSTLHLIIGFAKTPIGMVYTWTGHYYLDYFYYLQFIAQGLRGYWLPQQYSATDDPSIYFHLEPYLIIGQIGRIFGLTAISTYWLSVIVLILILALSIFKVIREILKDRPFKLQFAAFLIALSASPFFKLINDKTGLQFNFYEYWASYGNFFKRFEPVPHHLLAGITILFIFYLCHKYLSNNSKNIKSSLFFGITIGLLLSAMLTFYPFQIIPVFFAIAITVMLYFLKNIKGKKYREAFFVSLFIFAAGILILLSGLMINRFYYQTTFFQSTKGVEEGWRNFPPLKDVILNLGPVILLVLFGLERFVKKINSMGILLLTFVLISFSLFYSSLDLVLNTHNGRFLSPQSYILFAVIAVLGIEKIAEFFSLKKSSKVFNFIVFLLLIFSLPANIADFREKLVDKNLNSPISYLPKGIIDGFKFLDRQPEKGNVLLTPSQFLGTVMPAFADRKTYVARHAATPNYIEKNIRTSSFYLGAMANDEALNFLRKNRLKFVVLTSIEGYDVKKLFNYSFLKEIYRNKDIIIFKVK